MFIRYVISNQQSMLVTNRVYQHAASLFVVVCVICVCIGNLLAYQRNSRGIQYFICLSEHVELINKLLLEARNYRSYRNENLTNFFPLVCNGKKLKSCLLLLEMEQLLVFDMCLLRRSVAMHADKRRQRETKKTEESAVFTRWNLNIKLLSQS